MIIGTSATRNGITIAQCVVFCKFLNNHREHGKIESLHHGGCRGGDIDLDYTAWLYEIPRVVHPCNLLAQQGKWIDGAIVRPVEKPLVRNLHIIGESTMMYCFPKSKKEQKRGSGTWHVIRHCRKVNQAHIIIWDNGCWIAV